MPKRVCTFNDNLQSKFPFLKTVSKQDDRVKCEQCGSEFSVAHGGQSDINDHINSKKHKKSLEGLAGSSKISNFFKNVNPKDNEYELAAKEATLAYHTVNHNLSFNSNSCSSKLISKFFDPKFSLGKTKCEAIILNVLAPLALEELNFDLSHANFVALSMDASNKNEVKLVPLIVRYFKQESGVQIKLLDFKSLPGETAEILSNHLMGVVKENKLEEKVVGFCGDNCNTNFGGVKRRGKNNVFTLIQREFGRSINGIGCGAHIVHNTIQTAVDVLPIEIEALVVKIYKYFHIYTVRVTKLKEFCEFAGIEYRKLLQHGNTRFLSLMPAIERLLQIFSGLKDYFLSQEMCPSLIKNFFEDERGEVFLWFVHGQLGLFNKTILGMEKNKSSAIDVVHALEQLKNNLVERRESNFIPYGAKAALKSLQEKENVDCSRITSDFKEFYTRAISYVTLWEDSFGEARDFTWINDSTISWENVESSAELINKNIRKLKINIDELFDEVVLAKKFWSSKREEWEKEENENEKKIPSEDKWVELFRSFKQQNISVTNLGFLIEYIFCLPGTSAPVERVFSMMNAAWSDERGLMHESTVRSLMLCKINFGLNCTEFYDKIKNKKDVLKKIHSSEKYEWFRK